MFENKKVYELLPFAIFVAIGTDLMFGIAPAAITLGVLGLLIVGIWGGEK